MPPVVRERREDTDRPRSPLPPSLGGYAAHSADANAQVLADPLQPPGANGWTPANVTAVRSRNQGGFIGSALQFTLGGVEERPGQRLSTAQVDTIAPFLATEFGLDEGFVRSELAKVYLYVGGPSTTANQAMTIGHHIFMPTSDQLDTILSKNGKRWLVHELSHTMQFAAYQGGSPHRFLADYFTSMAFAKDPQQPGTGDGPAIWGTFFTALRSTGHPEHEIGMGASGVRDRFVSSVLPAATLAVPVAIVGGATLAAGRATTGANLLGTGAPMRLAMNGIAVPALVGAAIGSYGDKLGTGWSETLGGAAGGAIAGAALWKAGAFQVGGSHAATEIGHSLGRTAGIAVAAGATLVGAAIGFMRARASANTVRGWSSSAQLLQAVQERHDEDAKDLSFQDAIHDSHWLEIDAEASARTFVRGDWTKPAPGTSVEGRTPAAPEARDGDFVASLRDRLDWGVKLPLLLGIPAAVGAGAGVFGTRATTTVLKRTLQEGRPLGEAIQEGMLLLGNEKRGLWNSLNVGGSVTIAPLIAGGLVAPIAYDVTGSATVARIAGAASGALVGGTLLTLALKGKGAGLIATSGKVGVGMAIAGAFGFIAGGVATDALRHHERDYDTTRGASANS
jgi:hypothetical protein